MKKRTMKKWAEDYLMHQGYQVNGCFEPVRLKPWSQVYRLLASNEYIYLKKMSSPFAIEAKLLYFLSAKKMKALPTLLGFNDIWNCFLMKDAGIPLRDHLKKHDQLEQVEMALDAYAVIQLNSVDHVEDLLSLGILDWRLSKIPFLYQELISQKDFLQYDGLTFSEIENLEPLYLKVVQLCEALSHYSIPETLEHGDFHDNNVLIKNQVVTINDWGDAVISHPFFSLISFLESAKRHHGITPFTDKYNVLRDRYLHHWLPYESKEKLLTAFELTKLITPIKFAINFYRIVLCSTKAEFEPYRGTIAESLRLFMSEGAMKFN